MLLLKYILLTVILFCLLTCDGSIKSPVISSFPFLQIGRQFALLHGENACSLITEEVLSQAQYVKSVLKESLRLNPVSVGVGRVLPCDAVFSGYMVPKGTVVVTQNQVSCRLEKYFNQPNKFLPERWIRGSSHYQQPVSPYLLLPFGHGPRTCIARRLAEQNIQALLLSIIRNFKIEWKGRPDLDCLSLLINKPDQPLRFEFTQRKSQGE